MTAPVIIKSTDANMPVLSGTEGSLSALIRYIAPLLGWEIMFDNGPVIVVRPQSYKGGQSLFYRIDDRASRGGIAPRTAEIRAYESLSDIDTGAGLVGPVFIHKSYTANTTANAYEICGDQYGFYIHTCRAFYSADPSKAEILSYIGFSEPVNSNASPMCVIAGAADTASMGTSYAVAASVLRASSVASVPYCFVHRSLNGANINKPVAHIHNGGPHPVTRCMGDVSAGMYQYSGDLILARPYLSDGAAYTCHSYLPGLYYPCHSFSSIASLNIDIPSGSSLVVGDNEWISAYISTQTTTADYGQGYAIIDIGGEFRP